MVKLKLRKNYNNLVSGHTKPTKIKSSLLGIVVSAAALVTFPGASIAEIKVVEQDRLVEGLDGSAYQVRQTMFDNGNGTFTLIPGQRPTDLKALHEDICSSVGGIDIYDETTTSVSEDVIDVAVCDITDPKALAKIAKSKDLVRASAGKGEVKVPSGISTQAVYWPLGLNLLPANRNVPIGPIYRLTSYIEYWTKNGGTFYLSQRADKCTIASNRWVSSNAKGTTYIVAQCMTNIPGTWPVYLNASIPGLSASAVGEIRAR